MIRSYKDLEVYQESYELSLQMYRLVEEYPKAVQYDIGSHLRRAAISIPLNIAEGYGKKSSDKDFKRFLQMSLGSCNEVQVLLEMSSDLGYIDNNYHKKITQRDRVLGKRLISLRQKRKANL